MRNYYFFHNNHVSLIKSLRFYRLQIVQLFSVHHTLILFISNSRLFSDERKCVKLKQEIILLTLLICWAFLCVDVFCLNATRTDLCRVRVLFSRAQPFGPPLSKMHKESIHISVQLPKIIPNVNERDRAHLGLVLWGFIRGYRLQIVRRKNDGSWTFYYNI